MKDRAVAQKMSKFIELNTIGVSKDSQLRAAKILKAITDGYDRAPAAGDDDDDSSRLFHFARRKMVSRWAKLRAAVAASGIFTLPDELPGHCTFANETVSAYPRTDTHTKLDRIAIADMFVFDRSPLMM